MNKLIEFDEKNKVFHLHNDKISYILSVEEGGYLSHLYFGKKVNGYHGQLRYPRVDRGFSGNLPESLDRTYSLDSLLQGTVVLVIVIIAHRLWISKMRMVHLQPA